MLVILLILIFVRPFISSLAFPTLNFVLTGVFLGYLLIWIIVKGINLQAIHSLRYPLLFFCLALIVSYFVSSHASQNQEALLTYINGLLLFVVAASFNLEAKENVIKTFIFSGLIISLLAIYQYFLGFRHLLYYIAEHKISDPFVTDFISRNRVFFPFVTPNALGGYLAMIIPLVLSNKNRIWLVIPFFSALLLTKSIGALLSLFVGLIFYLFLTGKLKKIAFSDNSNERFSVVRKVFYTFLYHKKRGIFLLFGILTIIAVIYTQRASISKQHTQPIFSTMMRLSYWQDTLRIIIANPFTGIGLGNFNLAQSRYAHNSYLQIFAEMGILGIFAFFWIIVQSFMVGYKKLKLFEKQNYFIALLFFSSLVFLIHNTIDFTFYLPEISMTWWLVTGLLLSKEYEPRNSNSNL